MTELTTSRVNRQLRSLRSKCAALTSFTPAPPRPTVIVTYGHSSRSALRNTNEATETPPLAILQSLDKFSTRLHLDRAIVENMQLSKRIYEVRDAFKNIVQSAFGTRPNEMSQRVSPLTAICARVVGEHMQSEMDAALEECPEAENRGDEVRSQVMDDLYEQVPSAYRSYTFVAHSLVYILDTCPHHPTLLNALLEVCVAHRLVREARVVLHDFFMSSIVPLPQSSSGCPLTHPAHKNFLTMLSETCAGPGSKLSVPNRDDAPVINERTFTYILVDALSQPCPEQMQAWSSKAVARLARGLRQADFAGCFTPLVAGLAHSLVDHSEGKKKPAARSANSLIDVSKAWEDALDRLAKWLVSMLDVLHKCSSNDAEAYRACVDFLVNVEPLQVHSTGTTPGSPLGCVVDALCCLAVYCLASPFTPPLPAANPDLLVLERLLRSADVRNHTLDGLVSHIFPSPNYTVFRMPMSGMGGETPTPPPTQPTIDDGSIHAIEALATPLRTRNLLRCEVALYRGALEHVEDLMSAPLHAIPPTFQLTHKELAALRLQLLDSAEDAERRCYGSADPSQRPNGSGEWVWEEIVGSWVVKSPAPVQAKKLKEKDLERASKRRKVENKGREGATSSQAISRTTRRSHFRVTSNGSIDGESSRSSASSGSTGTANSARNSRSASRVASASSTNKENLSEDSEEEHVQDFGTDPLISCETDTTPVPRRIRSFATVLTDAQANKISIRAEREAAAKARAKPRASAPPRVFAVPASPASASAPPRRQSAFATIMADSHRNVISLRAEREMERARREALQRRPGSQSHEDNGLKRKRLTFDLGRSSSDSDNDDPADAGASFVEPESSPVRRGGPVEPSSDDALNLFAYSDSSPIVRHRVRSPARMGGM
ncbi:hypothetical protein C8Q80DRAFT_1257196 [Daedaleopsis nitida]|nr:hypothetical protein C8Q80DRAFT_1257196 [Daedaleopsis nitida]